MNIERYEAVLDNVLRTTDHRKDYKEVDPESGRVTDYADSRMMKIGDLVGTITVTIFASVLPMLAVIALFYVKDTLKRIGLSISFSAIFGIALRCFTSARLKDIFAATAA